MKVCPTCKSRCFDDMDTCYGCMHHFTNTEDDDVFAYPEKEDTMQTQKIPALSSQQPTSSKNLTSKQAMPSQQSSQIPEFFELDTFPYIELDDLVPVENLVPNDDRIPLENLYPEPKHALKHNSWDDISDKQDSNDSDSACNTPSISEETIRVSLEIPMSLIAEKLRK